MPRRSHGFVHAARWVFGLLAVTSAAPAAPEATKAAQGETDDGARDPLAIAGAVVPGVLVHGTGHYIAGRPETGTKLLAAEGVGIGLVLLGGIPIVLTGASRYVVGPAAGVVIAGTGLFSMSFLADVYGVSAPDGGTGRPRTLLPVVESRLGYQYVYDPVFSFRSFFVNGMDVRYRALRLSPIGWFGLGSSTSRTRLLGAYRFYGPRPDVRARDGTFIDAEAAVTHHRQAADGFTTTTGELFVNGRLDLRRFDRHLAGSFAEMGFGWGLQHVAYPIADAAPNSNALLLARYAFGLYLGRQGPNAGEVSIFYDHRHDDFAAGLKLTGLGSGVAGHFGVNGKAYYQSWGIGAEMMIGSAYVVALSALFRPEEPE